MSDVSDSVRLVLHRSLSSLFTSIAPERLAELCRHVDLRDLRVGEILMSEWDSATEVFILLKGCCGIYSQGTELRLRLVETVEQVGEIIGAQAFLEGRQFRSASIVALDEVQVAVLPGASFRELLSSDELAAGQLKARAAQLAINKLGVLAQYALRKLGVLADELDQQPVPRRIPQGTLRQYAAGSVIYHAGEAADCAWFLVAGEVALSQPGSLQPSETIRAGLLFGDSEVIAGTPRLEQAVALTSVEVLSFDARLLANCQQQGGRISTILTALASAHKLPQLGTVYRYLAQVDHQPCLVSDYTKPSGQRIRVRYFAHLPQLEAARQDVSGATVTLASPDRSRLIVLTPAGIVTGLTVHGEWNQLPDAMSLVLRGGSLADWQRKAFQSSGELLLENATSRTPAGAEIICACTNSTTSMLRAAARNATCVDDLTRTTGAGGICGGCRARLPLFLGQLEVSLCRLRRTPLAEGAIRIRLEAFDETPLPAAQTGQFIRVEALIDGTWVGRPYTLIDASARAYELGVKLEENGFFSNWLNTATDGTLVRVLPPQGDVCPASLSKHGIGYQFVPIVSPITEGEITPGYRCAAGRTRMRAARTP
ncbi:MAG: cyclic nucleotide-binding domain-containing protein, partial [Planctomyces sp.]